MKRILLSFVIVIGLSRVAAAQTSGSNSSNSTSVSSSREQTKSTKSSKSTTAQNDTLNNRDMYKWKDGQRATPTGHEATGTNGSHATLPKDSATAQSDSTKQ